MSSFLSSTTRAKQSPKAFVMGPKAQPDSDDITPLDCIFSCSVCGDVFSDVYQQRESVHGLSDGINTKDRIVTRLYIASCCHVICIKHIGGGSGPAFFPAGQQPEAPCPVCAKEKGDNAAKLLFSLRGFNADEHDPAIPRCWFKAPPMKLEGKDKEMEALRFQYLALTRFSKNIAISRKQSSKEEAEVENKLRSLQDLLVEKNDETLVLQEEVERLRPFEGREQKLRRLEAKMPAISHYLGTIPMLAEQNKLMQARLASLGFAMTLDPVPVFDGPLPFEENYISDQDEDADVQIESRNTTSSHTVGRSAPNLLNHGGTIQEEPPFSPPRRPLKRSRIDSPAQVNNTRAAPSSRDMMPPPPSGPLSKMKSIRKMLPTLRKKLSSGRSSTSSPRKPVDDPDTQMHDSGDWQANANIRQQSSDIDNRPPTRHGPVAYNNPNVLGMRGAEHDRSTTNPAPQQSGLLTGLGIHSNQSAFTFEAPSHSAIPGQQPGALPSERSYIRLLDPLGHDTRLDLGLEDPRESNTEDNSKNYHSKQQVHPAQPRREQQEKLRRNAPKLQIRDQQRPWNFGHAFLEQSPINANPTSAHLHSGPHYARDGDAVISHRRDNDLPNPTTPAPARFQRPVTEVDHVVSPFFGSGSHHSQPLSRSQFAEPDISSIRSAAYQLRRDRPSTDTDWHEPRSLNGLSFFDSPVNRRNERIDLRREPETSHTSPSFQYRGRNIDPQGFLIRTDAAQSPMQHDSTYGSLDRAHSTTVQPQSHSAIPFPSFNRSFHPQNTATRLPSAMPPVIPSHSPLRQTGRVEGLENLGVRSSQRSRLHNFANNFARSGRPAYYPSASRRVVRR